MQGDSDDFMGIGDLTDDPDIGEMGDIFGIIGGGLGKIYDNHITGCKDSEYTTI